MMYVVIILLTLVSASIVLLASIVNEHFFLGFLGVLGITLLAVAALVGHYNARIRAKARAAGASDGVQCRHTTGLAVPYRAACEIWSFPDRLQIQTVSPPVTFHLPYERLRTVFVETGQPTSLGRRSPGGREVPGYTPIWGEQEPNGTWLYYLVIEYQDEMGIPREILFHNNMNLIRYRQFANHVMEMAHRGERPSVVRL